MINKYRTNWTKSKEDLKQWDIFLKNDPRGHCQQVSHWLASFKVYGCDFEVLLVRDNENRIIAGVGVVIVGLPFFKVMVAPSGPIITSGYEVLFERILQLFLERAKQRKVFYCHINVPVPKENITTLSKHCINGVSPGSLLFTGRIGNKFTHVSSINGFRPIFIDYSQAVSPYEFVFSRFNANTKRNIKSAAKNRLELRFASTESELKEAYHIIETIATLQRYTVRTWESTKGMLLNMIANGLCLVPCCFANGSLKGALIVFDIGQRLTYISGGILREKKDLKVGHFLQNEMLKYSIENGYSFYDISVIGNEGVTRFKEGFYGHHIEFIGNRYWVMNKFKFSLYKIFSSFISRNKVLISKIQGKHVS